MWKHICLSAGICGSYNPCFTISPLWTSQYLIGAPGPLTSPLAPLAPRPQVQVQQSSAAPQTFVIKQVEPDPPAQEVSNYTKVRRLRSFTRLGVNMRERCDLTSTHLTLPLPHFAFTLPYLTLPLPHFTFTSPHLGQKESNYLHFQPARQPRPSNWSIPSVMVFKNLQTKININLDFMSWTCNIISPSHTAKRWEGYFLKCSQKSEQNTQHLTIF